MMKMTNQRNGMTWVFGLIAMAMIPTSGLGASPAPLRSADLSGRLEGMKVDQKLGRRGPVMTFRGRIAVENEGARSAQKSRVRVFLSRDRKLDRSDARLAELRVKALASGERAMLELDTESSATDHTQRYLLVAIDAADDVRESDERNNLLIHDIKASSGSSTRRSLEDLADFRRPIASRRAEPPQGRMTDISASFDEIRSDPLYQQGRPGVRIRGRLVVSNGGEIPARNFITRVYLSADREWQEDDELLLTHEMEELKAHKKKFITIDRQVSFRDANKKYVIAIVDVQDAVREIDEANNTTLANLESLRRSSSETGGGQGGGIQPSSGKHAQGVMTNNTGEPNIVYTDAVDIEIDGPVYVTAGVPKTIWFDIVRHDYEEGLWCFPGGLEYAPFLKMNKDTFFKEKAGSTGFSVTVETFATTAPGSYEIRVIGMTCHPIADQWCFKEFTIIVEEPEEGDVAPPIGGGTPDNGAPSVNVQIKSPEDNELSPYFPASNHTTGSVECAAFYDFDGDGLVAGSQGDPTSPYPRWTDPYGNLFIGSQFANRGNHQGNLVVYATMDGGSRFVAVHFAVGADGSIAPTLLTLGDLTPTGRILIYQEPQDTAWNLWTIEAGSYLPTATEDGWIKGVIRAVPFSYHADDNKVYANDVTFSFSIPLLRDTG